MGLPRASPPCPEARRKTAGAYRVREILDAVFYIVRGGCAWRLLPHDFPPWKTVPLLLQDMAHRRHVGATARGLTPEGAGTTRRDPQPSAGIVDSQSVKTTGVGAEERGYDPGKKVKGRKRQLLVDAEGLLIEAGGQTCDVVQGGYARCGAWAERKQQGTVG